MNRPNLAPTFAALAVSAALASFAPQTLAASTSVTANGAVYTMDYLLVAANDYKFTLHIDLTNYTGGGTYLDQFAFKIGASTGASPSNPAPFSVLSTPDGSLASSWTVSLDTGLSAGGCGGGGVGFVCVDGPGHGYHFGALPVPPSDVTFGFEWKGVTLTSAGVETKVRYVDDGGHKKGDLLSLAITPVPEPETYAMFLAGLGMMGFVARRRAGGRA